MFSEIFTEIYASINEISLLDELKPLYLQCDIHSISINVINFITVKRVFQSKVTILICSKN